ncbi:MAG: CinA family protein [Sulfurimonas sp.]|uniref:CinA family protein n=1 Tax=Sulfurimonas sp. TaxID=2022749 RepID=UPI00261420C1|nr:CinA family protein [Sulfurimonas sp.]MCW8894885.1 CinA family protein [Sulfurimonas sp.]MCW8954980.1 CinA family protein [Sulfurimonas sp.]MCW9067932.1 CinA family protein [Sulfurimonas sp.]
MKLHVIFIGNKFIYNTSLQEYVIRKIEQKSDFISSITYFKESDNSLFLYLENELNSSAKLLIVTSKHHFSTIGKLICTATSDNQILKDGMLIPSKVSVFENGSYLLEHNNSAANVLHVDEMQELPEILLHFEDSKATIHIFEEDKDSAAAMLNPIAQMYDVRLDIVNLIDGWLRVDVRSKKYGDISKFIHSAKQLLPNKLIGAACVVSYIIDRLSVNEKRITFAESCTGGLLTYYFTKNNGASKVLDGSLVTYSNALKENWLGVENTTLEKYGAVSNEVVSEMSSGAINVSSADYAISVSGVAGEGGGTKEKPVGTIHVSVRTKTKHQEARLNLSGDRNYIQHQSVLFAIKMLILIDKEMFF